MIIDITKKLIIIKIKKILKNFLRSPISQVVQDNENLVWKNYVDKSDDSTRE